jgi:dethiobiotin synthetase
MKKGIFIVGTDTDIGKTYQAVRLCTELRNRNVQVAAYKPAASGYPIDDPASDPSQLLRACGLDASLISRVCPQAFDAPLAPSIAAQLEGREVDEALLLAGARWWVDRCEFLVVEGAGGVLSPISRTLTVADLAVQIGLPIALVACNRLGCVNHTLLSIEALDRRGLKPIGIVLAAHHEAKTEIDAIGRRTNMELIQQFSPGVPVVDDIVKLLGS